METIGNQQLWSWLDGAEKAEQVSNTKVRKDRGLLVENYLDLAQKIAELQYRNRDYVLMFRGQATDHKNNGRNSPFVSPIYQAQTLFLIIFPVFSLFIRETVAKTGSL
jgi:hypothetical protein